MSFPSYDAYRPSDVPWLDDLPSHWEVTPLLRVVDECRESNAGMQESNLLSLSYGRIVRKDINANDGLLPESFETYQIIHADNIVLRLTDLQNDKRSLRSAIVEEKGIITSAYLALRVHSAVPRFLHYLLRAYDSMKVFYSMGGGLRQSMKFSDLRRMPVIAPPAEEQAAIATFLDRETTKIDALVAEQEKLVAVLKEKRQAVASHTVTKGIDPSAKLQDSHLQWLGLVPAHWTLKRIKHAVATIEQGWSPQCDGFPVQHAEEWGVLKVGCVNGGTFRPDENKALPDSLEPIASLGIKSGDLLVSRANTRELVGHAAVVPQDHPNLLLCDKLYRLRFRPRTCDPVFVALFLGSRQARSQIELAATGASSSMVNIGQSTILELPIAVPPMPEQAKIVESVLTRCRAIDALIQEAGRTISLLTERRTALISAAVTGKIDVRGAVALEPA